MAKRDEDSQADMEVGMTTAERRRKRRRGGGLRVPSDNVPRARAPTAPPAPRPEDPSLAMSIAYSFSNDGSSPVRMIDDIDSGPIAPEAAPTMIDPPSPDSTAEGVDFDMKTREMAAVDLEALGLADGNPATTLRMERMSSPGMELKTPSRSTSDVEIDVSVDGDSVDTAEQVAVLATGPAIDERMPRANRNDDSAGVSVNFTAKPTRERLQTVALSDADLEELRISRADSTPVPVTPKPITKPPPIATARTSSGGIPLERVEPGKTQQLNAVDIEVLQTDSQPVAVAVPPAVPEIVAKTSQSEPMSVPEIDINELADRAESSGEIDVAVDDSEELAKRPPIEMPRPPVLPRAATAPPVAPVGDTTKPKIVLPDGAHPPPTPPAPPPMPAAKAPPAPPPKTAPKPPPAVAPTGVVTAKDPGKAARGKPWFVDLFDEDYLRTLPFLTPQATQSEAEFVIEAMNLAPGAQVLDVGCGYGRHAMELAARGFHVVGLDLSTPLLVRGGEEAHRRGLTINFIRGDMRELDFENQFDAAYSLFSTFGYFDDETNKKTLQNIARALKPNGKLLIEILNRDYVIADLPTRVWWEGDGCVVLEEVELNYFSSRIQVNRSVVFDDGRQLEQEISVRAYSLHEVGKLMHAAGFRVLEVSGGYQMRGRFFGNQSRHIIVLAERKETPAS
ncbi:MAG TPA: class I SAM-dependent methyltransferase [Kofleriaceae bacterium]|nr:class I SAM-dependent methyltransferase [Kofleriaceae bacterium]